MASVRESGCRATQAETPKKPATNKMIITGMAISAQTQGRRHSEVDPPAETFIGILPVDVRRTGAVPSLATVKARINSEPVL